MLHHHLCDLIHHRRKHAHQTHNLPVQKTVTAATNTWAEMELTDKELGFISGGSDPDYGYATDGNGIYYKDNLGYGYTDWSSYYSGTNQYQQ